MTQSYFTVITVKGLEKMSRLAAQKKEIQLEKVVVGSGGGASYDPTPEQLASLEKLIDVVFETEITEFSYDKATPNQYYVGAVIPVEAGPFVIREAAWIDVDGDIIYATKYPPIEKTTPSQGAMIEVPIGTYISTHYVDGANINVIVNPSRDFLTRETVSGMLVPEQVAGDLLSEDIAFFCFVSGGEVELPDKKGIIRVIVDEVVNLVTDDCVVFTKSNYGISTKKGIDNRVRLVEKGREFVFFNDGRGWRVF